jgi:hypothetical protein
VVKKIQVFCLAFRGRSSHILIIQDILGYFLLFALKMGEVGKGGEETSGNSFGGG